MDCDILLLKRGPKHVIHKNDNDLTKELFLTINDEHPSPVGEEEDRKNN